MIAHLPFAQQQDQGRIGDEQVNFQRAALQFWVVMKRRSLADSCGALALTSVLVGRDHEPSILLHSLETLTAVEPGGGKSRLVAEARRRSAAKGVLWL